MVMAADRVAVLGVRMPGESPTSVDVAVALAEEDDEGGNEGQFANV